MKNRIRNSKLKAVILYNIFFIISVIAFYYLIPLMLNYPPNSINTEFETTIDMGMYYIEQYLIIVVAMMLISNAYFITRINSIGKYKKCINSNDEGNKEKLDKIIKKCFSIPYQIYLIHATVPSLAVIVVMTLTGTTPLLTLGIVALVFSFTLVLGLLSYIFSKNVFDEILTELNNQKLYEKQFKITFQGRIILLFLPLLFLALLFIVITANMLLTKERGNFIYENYHSQMQQQNYQVAQNISDVKTLLNNIQKHEEEDTLFIITKEEVIYQDNDAEITDFFRKYTFDVAEEGHTYGYYASGIQGAFEMVKLDETQYAVGVMYLTDAPHNYLFLIETMLILMVLCLIFLLYFSKEISEQVVVVADNMDKIANEEVMDYDQKLPVVSNDELGHLVIAFNTILDLEKEHAEEMERNQEMLIERERLSSVGQLIGGMAHNLKTPIMSIAGAVQALKDLITEYEESISNPQVTDEDHHEIAKEMEGWNEKIKVYLEYMTEVINATKGQAVSMNASTVDEFSVEELVTRVKILMKDQLLTRNCTLDLNVDVGKDVIINGEISAIVQVIDNLIVNAMDAYAQRPGKIILRLKDDSKKLYIEVEDFAGGIPEHIQEKLFKQMITTKGKNGTGLGLYMCYSTIKGKFNGEMRFETELGKGTTFFIELNKKAIEKEQGGN